MKNSILSLKESAYILILISFIIVFPYKINTVSAEEKFQGDFFSIESTETSKYKIGLVVPLDYRPSAEITGQKPEIRSFGCLVGVVGNIEMQGNRVTSDADFISVNIKRNKGDKSPHISPLMIEIRKYIYDSLVQFNLFKNVSVVEGLNLEEKYNNIQRNINNDSLSQVIDYTKENRDIDFILQTKVRHFYAMYWYGFSRLVLINTSQESSSITTPYIGNVVIEYNLFDVKKTPGKDKVWTKTIATHSMNTDPLLKDANYPYSFYTIIALSKNLKKMLNDLEIFITELQ